MTDEERMEMRDTALVCVKTAPGEWRTGQRGIEGLWQGFYGVTCDDHPERRVVLSPNSNFDVESCSRFVVAAQPSRVLRLLAERDALDAENERLRVAIAAACPTAPSTGLSVCVAALVTDEADRVLLIRSAKPGRAWELPGGKMRASETWQEAVHREVYEETGLNIMLSTEQPAIRHGAPKPGAEFSSLIIVVRARGTGRPTPGDDAAGVDWFRSGALPELSDLETSKCLRDWARYARVLAEPACAADDCAKSGDGGSS